MILTDKSFVILRERLFGGSLTQTQVNSLNYLVARCEHFKINYSETAYVLATVFHETGYLETVNGHKVMNRYMRPVKERGSQEYLEGKKYYPYIGYGYVQLTWYENFLRVGKLIGVDLIKNPEKALEPAIASEILIKGMVFGWFTGVGFHRKCPVYRYNKASYVRARKIVNGTDKADLIAGYAMDFEKALRS
jgi:hypothetical protein